ncbi:MAG: cysteine--tRNA ligase [Actinomycetota bacterium]|nr:cysteine--tRNA ligase [Actinomycetota bacterium]
MGLVVYNTFSRRKEPFEPVAAGRVSIYVCGPTVYDLPHLGHARAAVAFDVIRRTFRALGYDVTYVMNITDVDDKIITRANEEGRSPFAVADEYTRAYQASMARVGVLPPDIAPRATGHIIEMVALVEQLIGTGAAYPVEGGDVYFSVRSFGKYGELSNRSLDDMRAGERVEPDPRKRDPMDFALWKGAKPGEPSWPSPWGPGRPGWHLECSAMSMKYLGESFDVHGGGQDLIFPHHENERAQSEAVTTAPFVRFWLHNGFVTINEEKMSKSLKNFVSLDDVLAQYPAPAVRMLLVAAHYRSPIDFSPDGLDEAGAMWQRFSTFARNATDALDAAPEIDDGRPLSFEADFFAALEDDFNTPSAVAVLFELVNAGNVLVEQVEAGGDPRLLRAHLATFSKMAGVLGLDPLTQWPAEESGAEIVGSLVESLLEMRERAREARDFETADLIRERLVKAGVVVEDRPGGPRWRIKR